MSAIKMKAGKSKDMQYWLRARVALQGLTLVALVVGSMAIQASRKSIGDNGASSFLPSFSPSHTSPAEGVPRNEAVAELLREQKKERGKVEFEERLKGAELAHAEEQAIAARGSATAQGSGTPASIDKPGTLPASTDVNSSTKSRSLWTRWFGRGSSKDSSESSNKS